MIQAGKYLLHRTTHDFGKYGAFLCRTKSSNSTKQELSSLQKWHDAVAAIPVSQILPTGFGNKSGTAVKEAAWYGDKLIGEQVALQLHNFLLSMNGIVSSGEQKHKNIRHGVRMLYIVAVSNKLFADKLKVILPSHAPKNVPIVSKHKVHDAGTMIEAAVFAVSNHSKSRNYEALETLAKFLIVQAAQETGTLLLPNDMNEKLLIYMNADCFERTGTEARQVNAIVQAKKPSTFIIEEISEEKSLFFLNKYGGKVDCMDLNRHPPLFRATAVLNGSFASSEASRKKTANRRAAYTLLMTMKKAHNKQIHM